MSEAPSLETSNLCLYFSGSCIPINPKLSPRIFSCFQFDFSVKSIKFSTRNSKYFFYILQQLPSMRRTHVGNPTWINSISRELCPPFTCERACSGNEIGLVSVKSSSAHPPRAFAAFPNPGGGAIAPPTYK
jgi:hypothetical protein